jgi:hypothetical protein
MVCASSQVQIYSACFTSADNDYKKGSQCACDEGKNFLR